MIGRKVWQWCSTKEALILLLIPVVVSLIASYLLPQAPAYLRSDKFRYQAWLSDREVEFTTWTPLLVNTGAFYIRETLWFRVLVTLLAFVLLITLAEQVFSLFGPTAVRKPPTFYDAAEAQSLSSPLPYEQAVRQVQQNLQHALVQADEPDTTYLYASHHAWVRASTALRLLGLLLLVSGLAIQTRWGWRQSDIQVLPYENVALEQGSALQLRLLDPQPYSQSRVLQTVPTAELQIAGQTVLPIQFDVPVQRRGYRYRWVSKGGPSVRLRAYRTSDRDQPLTLYNYAVQPTQETTLQFTFAYGKETDHQFILSEDKIVGWLRWDQNPSSANEGSLGFYLWIFGEDGQKLGEIWFEQVQSEQDTTTLQAILEDVVYRLEVVQYIVLDVAYQPGRWVLWLGWALLALGMLGLLVPQRQIWIKVSAASDNTEIKIREQRQGLIQGSSRRSGDLAAQLDHILQTPAPFKNSSPPEQNQDLSTGQNDTTHKAHP